MCVAKDTAAVSTLSARTMRRRGGARVQLVEVEAGVEVDVEGEEEGGACALTEAHAALTKLCGEVEEEVPAVMVFTAER